MKTAPVDCPAAVLAISPAREDHATLQGIFDDSTEVLYADSLSSALAVLQEQSVAIVICEHDLGPHTWKHVLESFEDLSNPPKLIVASRVADEYLWSEALNLGAYDVLAKPFDVDEVVRTVDGARRPWAN
jgi:two-component system, NtrC family, response regulator HupR/HoxA